jgi:hypothetical protein
MIELTAPANTQTVLDTRLDAITQAYGEGDTLYGELLFTRALDDGLPWDQVCAAAASGIAQHYDRRGRD